MSNDESSNYALWVMLANDPSQSEEARQHYRAQMEVHVRQQLRAAFQAAAKQALPPASTSPRKG